MIAAFEELVEEAKTVLCSIQSGVGGLIKGSLMERLFREATTAAECILAEVRERQSKCELSHQVLRDYHHRNFCWGCAKDLRSKEGES